MMVKLLIFCILWTVVSAAPGAGRIFEVVSPEDAQRRCPEEFPALQRSHKEIRQPEFLLERAPLNNQTLQLELSQLLSSLQQAILLHKLTFNVSETNQRLPRTLIQAPDARSRHCPPIFELDADGLLQTRFPSFVLTVACSDGCRPVRRDVTIYRLLCNSANDLSTPVFYNSGASIAVDCAPVVDSW